MMSKPSKLTTSIAEPYRKVKSAFCLAGEGIGESGSLNNNDSRDFYTGSRAGGSSKRAERSSKCSQLSSSPLDSNSRAFRDKTDGLVVGGGQRGNLDEIKQAWGDFLEGIGKGLTGWDWFATFTFRNPENPKYPNWTQPGWQYAHRALWHWNDAIMSNMFPNGAPYWIAMMEYQRWRSIKGVPGMNRGVPHWHLLVGATQDERRMDWVDWWYKEYGLARILPYQAELGARFYLAKYLTKEMAGVRWSPQLRLSQRKPRTLLNHSEFGILSVLDSVDGERSLVFENSTSPAMPQGISE